jgi:chemotaxis protein methyltransferase CheR
MIDDFYILTGTIEKILHIQCGSYKEDYIKRRVSSRMNAVNITDYWEYNRYLIANPNEQELLKNALTINVTKFFRDPEVFEAIRREILPNILKNKERIRIWSAGCSSGEEPYSLAIILYEIGILRPSIDAFIYATDIDREILKRAKEGVYEKSSLENLTEHQLRKHFIERPDGKYEVRPHIKEKVRFHHHDLMKGQPISRFLDIISCRNVTIYFHENQKNELCKVFNEGLVPGGYYIMGLSEYLGREVEHLFVPYRPHLKIFTKNHNTHLKS